MNFSNSIPLGLYFRVSSGETVQVGDIVAYYPTDEVVQDMRRRGWFKEQDPLPFLKYVGALSGDVYSADGHSFYINGEYVGEILDTDSSGNPLPRHEGTHQVPPQEFLPLASDNKGFDGRYTGCVPLNRIFAKVIPIWVVN